MNKLLCYILIAIIMLGCFPALPASADDSYAGKSNEMQIAKMTGDVQVWEDGSSIYVRYEGMTRKICSLSGENYILFMYEQYIDSLCQMYKMIRVITFPNDGPYITANISESSKSYEEDGSLCFWYSFSITNAGNPREYTLCFADLDEFSKKTVDDNSLSRGSQSFHIYQFPFDMGYYDIYSTKSVGSLETRLLPGAPDDYDGNSYRTVLRMLNDSTVTYNVLYYENCYLSDDYVNVIGGSGVRVDAVKYSDGSVTRTRVASPYLLCQVSTYGTAYDIVYTNDTKLCTYLGIEKPVEKVWNVTNQRWEYPSGGEADSGGSGGGSGGEETVDPSLTVKDENKFGTLSDLSVSLVGADELIDPVTFNNYFAGQLFHQNKLEDLNTKVWGLGNRLTWSYDGIYSEEDANVEPGTSGSLIDRTINIRKVKLVVTCKFLVDATTTKSLTYVVNGFDDGYSLPVKVGERKISFYDLCLFYQDKYPAIVKDFPTQLVQISYSLTPYYYDKADGKYYYGKTSKVVQNVKSALADYTTPDWSGSDGSWSDEVSPDIGDSVESVVDTILNMLGGIPKLISKMFTMLQSLVSGIGEVPAMFGSLFPFIPQSIIDIMCTGLVCCVVIGLFRWIRG